MRYRISLSYDGTSYVGWQVQGEAKSIQSLLQKALITALRHPLDLTGAGRTDSGVHAYGQTAHFDSDLPIDPRRLILSLNALLPPDIRVRNIEPVPPDFHARYSATGKIYHYHLHLDRVADPFTAPYRYHVLERLDLDLLRAATQKFLGTRDFTSFANEAYRGSASRDPVRTLKRFDIIEQPGGIRLELEADGFLYRMVRNLVGTLIEVARGKIPIEEIDSIFAARNRSKAGPSAPPHALFLMEVLYDSETQNADRLDQKAPALSDR